MLSFEEKVITKYTWIKHKYHATKIVNNHSEYEWDMNDVNKPLKIVNKTGDVA